ncbi:E3 ubiquitin-protein ligase SPL2-like [Iris pallida]|uniref:RING-type E3 ubiquitin transferase n=1 Tax=Iris pallida TaxID=29817 RepID=A0AAX6EN76_IRIPA|nr:E3 ubiquitin-protein ligase SPL2-like [Iris pallida]
MSSRDEAAAAAIVSVAATWDGALVGVALAVFAASAWAKYFSTSASLRRIAAAPSPRISDLRSLLPPKESDSHEDRDGPLVVVRGAVSALKAQIVSQSSGERGVIVQRTQTFLYNEWRGIFGWSFDLDSFIEKTRKEPRSCSVRSVPFVLVDGGYWPHSGFVHVSLDCSSHPLPLTTVYHHLHPVQATPYTFLQAIFGNGYAVGLLDEEKILPVGEEITAVGICRTQHGIVEIKSCPELPCFLSNMTKGEIEADLEVKTRILFWSGFVLGAVSISILSYAVVRNWQRWKSWRQVQQLHEDAQVQTSSDNGSDDVPDGQLCIICLMRRRRSAFVPCGHLVCCSSCAMSVERNSSPKCPLCRQNIRSSIRIYDS